MFFTLKLKKKVFDDGLRPPTEDGCHAAPRDTLNILEVGSCPQYLCAYSAQPRVSLSPSLWPWLAGKCPISPRPTGQQCLEPAHM